MRDITEGESLEDNQEDDLYEDARNIVLTDGKASTSYLQRRLGIGYSRAAKILDALEAHGIVGPANGSKPREILGGVGAGVEQTAPSDIPQQDSQEKIS
jgi:S-DNA-T family DNA segregation ATPase FtsK/SpoIIIE